MSSRCTRMDRRGRRCLRGVHWYGACAFTPIPKVGAKKIREIAAEGIFRHEVRERADGWCEAAGCVRPDGGYVCQGRRQHVGHEAHHIWPEDRDCGVHDPERGMWLCAIAHEWTTGNPAAASVLGLMRPERAS